VKSSCTTNALSDLVVPAKDEEKSSLLCAQKTRPTTIEMTEKPRAAEDDGVVWRDRSSALRARSPLLFTEPFLAQYPAVLSASHAARQPFSSSPGEVKVVALARHADGDVSDPGPGVEPGAERVERAVYLSRLPAHSVYRHP
jgi:hypothetical protein